MDRRTFIGATAGLLCAASRAAGAQAPGRVYRLGVLAPTAPPLPSEADVRGTSVGVPDAMREYGYVEGRYLVVERRFAEGKLDRLPALARELVHLPVDTIVAVGSAAVVAAKNATTTVPIVMFGNFDPVAAGLVTSLARPGGNVTGVLIAPEGTLAAKKVELLKEAVPRATRMAMLVPEDPGTGGQQTEVQQAAFALGLDLIAVTVQGGNYDRAFATIAAARPGTLFVLASTYFVRDRKPIIALAQKHRLPAMYEWREHVVAGGLMAYGSSLLERHKRIAYYVDRIFKGANPGELPIDQPTTFELVINAKTAKAIGLTVPQSLLLRANEVIQ